MAQMEEAVITASIGPAMRNSGMFEMVQYRNKPTFLPESGQPLHEVVGALHR